MSLFLCARPPLPYPTTSCKASMASLSHPPLRYAVLGAGFAGLSVAWHLLKHSSKDLHLHVDLYDEVGVGGGASGVSGGLLHPYSPKAKLLWQGAECWKECLKLLNVAEATMKSNQSNLESEKCDPNASGFIVRRRGILKPVTNIKTLGVMNENARNCLASCRIETIDSTDAQTHVPNLSIPFNLAYYMPEAVNVHPQRYLQALFLACQDLVTASCNSGSGVKQLNLHKRSVHELLELEGKYNGVIICLGAKADLLPELVGKLPLRTCRGVVAHFQLPDDMGDVYPENGPSILSEAWLAIQGSRSLQMGSTWKWKSRNSSPNVSETEAFEALEELMPKASALYPSIKNWSFTDAKAGLRAMPPLTSHGSLPLLGCVNDLIGVNNDCKYWLFGGLGARGLLYHAWLGKLMAQAVLSCKEDLIPSELTSWKNLIRQQTLL